MESLLTFDDFMRWELLGLLVTPIYVALAGVNDPGWRAAIWTRPPGVATTSTVFLAPLWPAWAVLIVAILLGLILHAGRRPR